MSEPQVTYQAAIENPDVQSTVPEEQKLRDGTDIKPLNPTKFLNEKGGTTVNEKNSAANQKDMEEKPEAGTSNKAEKIRELAAENNGENRKELAVEEDFVLTPVMTVTKEEAVFTKGDLKLQKVSVSEDISGTKVTRMVHERVTVTNSEPVVTEAMENVQKTRADRNIADREPAEVKKAKTRIPMLRFRQAVDKVRKERRGVENRREPENSQPKLRRSSIPRLKDSRIAPPNSKDSTSYNTQKTDENNQLDEEFDRLYDDLVDDQDSDETLSIASKIEDPVILENTFDEIIYAYEDNTVQPINVDKVRHSKIPLLKRKSEHDIEVPLQAGSMLKKTASLDTSITTSEFIAETHSKIKSVTLNKRSIRSDFVTTTFSETKSVYESSKEAHESLRTTDNVRIEANNQSSVIEDVKEIELKDEFKSAQTVNELKGNTSTVKKEIVKIVTPDFHHLTTEDFEPETEKGFHETEINKTKAVQKMEQSNYVKDNEMDSVSTSLTTSYTEVQNDTKKKVTETKATADKVLKDSGTGNTSVDLEKNEEDIAIIRGKVNRIIKRLDSIETTTKPSQQDLGDDLTGNTSVMSKIAMFQRNDTVEVPTKSRFRCISQIPRLKNSELNDNINEPIQNTPKIVNEVLKAVPARVIEEKSEEDSEKNINETVTKASENNDVAVTKFGPTDGGDEFDIQTINVQAKLPVTNPPPLLFESKSHEYSIDDNVTGKQTKVLIDTRKITDEQRDFHEQTTKTPPPTPVSCLPENDLIISDQMPTEMQKKYFNPAFVDSDLVISVKIGNSKDNTVESLNSNGNKNYSANGYQEVDFKPVFAEKDNKVHEKVQNDKTYYKSFSVKETKNESYTLYRKAEFESDVFKREVNCESKATDNKTLIEENGIYHRRMRKDDGQLKILSYRNNELDKTKQDKIKSKSVAELDLGNAVSGKVRSIIGRMNSFDRIDLGKKELIDIKERPRKRSVSEKIALFEGKLTTAKLEKHDLSKHEPKQVPTEYIEEDLTQQIEELVQAKIKYGSLEPERMKYLELRDGGQMPVIGLGTALLHPKLVKHIVRAAIDLGYRTIDTAYIYGNEREVGEAINEKIKDGTITREDLFIISKLWSTFHRQDLVESACRASLDAMGLDYFDLYLIHNPISFKEGRGPIPKIASVVQYSEHDYMNAWFGIEGLVLKGLVRRAGVSNFNSVQVDRVVEKGKIKPVINQVECHPYLSQQRLDDFCQARKVKLCCFGVLGSKGTPQEFKCALPPAIDDPLVRVMAAGLEVSPAALLISYQLSLDRSVVVKASSAANLWSNLQALSLTPSSSDVSGLHALNRNKRNFTFKGMGDTHKNYPFSIPF